MPLHSLWHLYLLLLRLSHSEVKVAFSLVVFNHNLEFLTPCCLLVTSDGPKSYTVTILVVCCWEFGILTLIVWWWRTVYAPIGMKTLCWGTCWPIWGDLESKSFSSLPALGMIRCLYGIRCSWWCPRKDRNEAPSIRLLIYLVLASVVRRLFSCYYLLGVQNPCWWSGLLANWLLVLCCGRVLGLS